MKIDCGLQRGKTKLVTTQRAKKRFAFQGVNESLLSRNNSRLWPAEELVAAKADQIGSGFQCVRRRRLVLGDVKLLGRHDRAAAQILDKRNSLFPCERSDFRRRWRLDKTTHEKIAAMNFQNHRAPETDSASVIVECSFVGCSDLAQGRSRSFNDLANSKTAPNLHELTA